MKKMSYVLAALAAIAVAAPTVASAESLGFRIGSDGTHRDRDDSAALVPSSIDMIAGCTAAGTSTTATERSSSSVAITGTTNQQRVEKWPLTGAIFLRAASSTCSRINSAPSMAPKRSPDGAKRNPGSNQRFRDCAEPVIGRAFARPVGYCALRASSLVIASEAKQSIGPHREKMDCFVAEPVIGRAFARPVGSSQ